MKVKDLIINFLTECYESTGWPYIYTARVTNHFGFIPKNDLNELYKENRIEVHDGIQGKLLKLCIK